MPANDESPIEKAVDYSADSMDTGMDWAFAGFNALCIILVVAGLIFPPAMALLIIPAVVALAWNYYDALGAFVLAIKDGKDKDWVSVLFNLLSSSQLTVFTLLANLSLYSSIGFGPAVVSGMVATVGQVGAGYGFALAMFIPAVIEFYKEWRLRKKEKAQQAILETYFKPGNTTEMNVELTLQQYFRSKIEANNANTAKWAWVACGLFMSAISSFALPTFTLNGIAIAAISPVGAFGIGLAVAGFCVSQALRESWHIEDCKQDLIRLYGNLDTKVRSCEESEEKAPKAAQQIQFLKTQIIAKEHERAAHIKARNYWLAASAVMLVLTTLIFALMFTAVISNPVGLALLGIAAMTCAVGAGVYRTLQNKKRKQLEAGQLPTASLQKQSIGKLQSEKVDSLDLEAALRQFDEAFPEYSSRQQNGAVKEVNAEDSKIAQPVDSKIGGVLNTCHFYKRELDKPKQGGLLTRFSSSSGNLSTPLQRNFSSRTNKN